jgi:hypothetical protein
LSDVKRTLAFIAELLANDAISQALQLWSEGQQQPAVDAVRPAADADDPAALGLICWFMYQRGEPLWREGVPYAIAAVKKGMPWVANYYLGNMQNDPALRNQLPDLLDQPLQQGFQHDPVATAYNAFSNGDRPTAVRLVALARSPTASPTGWDDFIERARREYEALSLSTQAVSDRQETVLTALQELEDEARTRRSEVTTRTQQLLKLVDQTTNAGAQSFFDTEATQNEKEARFLWRWSVGLLSGATLFAVAPITLYYVGLALDKNWLRDQNLVWAHFAPAVALGAVAGVLLARARGRDRARQRAKDLSVALGTMFVYSGQIADEEQKQTFLRDMGRTVIEAFLRQDSSAAENESTSLLSALLKR